MNKSIEESQNFFVTKTMQQMTRVLLQCNQSKKDCVCSIQVSYLDDPNIPESMRYRTSLFCAEKGNNQFFDNAVSNLNTVNDPIDIMKK